jgi:hypothetical protein
MHAVDTLRQSGTLEAAEPPARERFADTLPRLLLLIALATAVVPEASSSQIRCEINSGIHASSEALDRVRRHDVRVVCFDPIRLALVRPR